MRPRRRRLRHHRADLDRRGMRPQQFPARRPPRPTDRTCRASAAPGVRGGMLSAVKLWKSSSISGTFGRSANPMSAKDRDDLLRHLADRVETEPSPFPAERRQREIDVLLLQPCFQRSPLPARRGALSMAAAIRSLSPFNSGPAVRRSSGRHRAERLHEVGHPPFAAQRRRRALAPNASGVSAPPTAAIKLSFGFFRVLHGHHLRAPSRALRE